MSQASLFNLMPERHVWKVSELTERVRDLAGEARVRPPHRPVSTTYRVVGRLLYVGVHQSRNQELLSTGPRSSR